MDFEYYAEDQAEDFDHVAQLYADVEKQYPGYAEPAKQLIIEYLEKHDTKRLALFLGYYNPEMYGFERITVRDCLFTSHCFAANLLKERDEGNPVITPIFFDVMMRRYLQLPPKVIENDKAD
jgi:hypothetical protein